MAGTWGPDGLKLYLDGKLEGEADFKNGPTVFAETFEINNALHRIQSSQRIASLTGCDSLTIRKNPMNL